jgi:uncharacterized repeat protein (TIGR04138 family)
MKEIDFSSDSFADIVGKDSRYDAHAYALLMDCVHFLSRQARHMSSEDVMEEFRERALDQYGPMAYTVLTQWGLSATEDIGEMMFNLVESNRISKDDDDRQEDFCGGYDFREVFLGPYRT